MCNETNVAKILSHLKKRLRKVEAVIRRMENQKRRGKILAADLKSKYDVAKCYQQEIRKLFISISKHDTRRGSKNSVIYSFEDLDNTIYNNREY